MFKTVQGFYYPIYIHVYIYIYVYYTYVYYIHWGIVIIHEHGNMVGVSENEVSSRLAVLFF